MQEVTKTLIAILESEWSLTGDVHSDKISFNRGEPSDPMKRFLKYPIVIEAEKMTRPVSKRVLARSMSRELVLLTVWLHISPKSETRYAEVKDQCQTIEDEIESIIKAQQRLLTDIKFTKIVNSQYVPRYDELPPTFRCIFTVSCQYEK